MTEAEEKKQFAELLLRSPDDPFKAALTLFPENTARALRVATEWPNDPEVRTFKKEINNKSDQMEFLPGKAEFCRLIWERMQNAYDAEDFAKIAKLYAETRGFIEKAVPVTNVNVQQNRVMIVKDHGDDNAWESKLKEQQRALVNGEFAVIEH